MADYPVYTQLGKPDALTAYVDWDAEDPNQPWAWRALWLERDGTVKHEESGPFEGTPRISDKTAARRAKAACGFPRHKIEVKVSR